METLVAIGGEAFHSMNDLTLLRACVEPAVQLMRGKDANARRAVYETLTTGQKALFTFWVLYAHSGSTAEFTGAVEYLVSELKAGSEMNAGASYFGIDVLAQVLDDVNCAVESPGLIWVVEELYPRYRAAVANAPEMIAAHIRSNPGHFVQISD